MLDFMEWLLIFYKDVYKTNLFLREFVLVFEYIVSKIKKNIKLRDK